MDHKYTKQAPGAIGVVPPPPDTQEKVEVPQEWATLWKNSDLKDIKVHWVTSEVIMDYTSFLKMQYVSRNVDTEGDKFEVKKIAWINYGYGEVADEKGNFKLK